MSKRKWTKREERVLLGRLQEYVDIGWNGGKENISPCPLCALYQSPPSTSCRGCPLADYERENCCPPDASYRRNSLRHGSTGKARSLIAKAHARWLMKRFNAAGFEVGLIDEVIE